jgi:hypothetical protein
MSDPKSTLPQIAETRLPDDEGPVELPADVPEEALRLAPFSAKNRLSYTLGLKPKDLSEHRVSSIYYPRALGDLLKIQQSPPAIQTPVVSSVQTGSPKNATDYFSPHRSSVMIHMDGTPLQQSHVNPPDVPVPRIAVRSPTAPVEEPQATSVQPVIMSSPALNSHTAVMSMASPPTPPVELPAADEHQESGKAFDGRRRASRSTVDALSSLGEPGPEVTSSEVDADEPRDWPSQILDLPQNGPLKGPRIMSGMDLPETVMMALSNQPERSSINTEPTSPRPEGIPLPYSPTVGTPTIETHRSFEQFGAMGSSEPNTPVPGVAADKHVAARPIPITNGEVDSRPTTAVKTEQKSFVAELEAEVPRSAAVATPRSSHLQTGPVEMEAAAAHFVLPARATAREIKVNRPPPTVVTVRQRIQAMRPGSTTTEDAARKPKDFDQKKVDPEPIKPLRLKLAKVDGKVIPVQAHSPGTEASKSTLVRTGRLSTDVISSLIDSMSDTPVTSPIAESPSETSSGSGHRSSRQFGPPESAPPPPGPGGRAMVNPDYANAGAFDGERKQAPKLIQRHSAGGRTSSISAIKELVSGASSRRHSSDASGKSTRQHSRVNSDMLDSAGKDVLWFNLKGLGKDRSGAAVPPTQQAVGVSSS